MCDFIRQQSQKNMSNAIDNAEKKVGRNARDKKNREREKRRFKKLDYVQNNVESSKKNSLRRTKRIRIDAKSFEIKWIRLSYARCLSCEPSQRHKLAAKYERRIL